MMRDSTSLGPPGVNATMMVTGWVGYSAAGAAATIVSAAASAGEDCRSAV